MDRRCRRPGCGGFQIGKRFLFQGDDCDVVARAPRVLEHQEGEPAIPRDEA
jgi:hypothetical protein